MRWKMVGISNVNNNDVPAQYLGWDACQVLDRESPRLLDHNLGLWFDQVENYYMSLAGLDPAEDGARHCGRVMGPQIG